MAGGEMDQVPAVVATLLGVLILVTSVSSAVREEAGPCHGFEGGYTGPRFHFQEEACAALRLDVRGKGGGPWMR